MDFYLMRPGEFWEAIDAHSKEVTAGRRHVGELARGIALRLFNIGVDKKSRYTDPAKFWKMPWDEDVVDEGLVALESMSDDERAAQAHKFLKRIGWKTNG